MDEKISLVIPVYNEEGNILPLYGEIEKTARENRLALETIFVDDGSSDGSAQEIERTKSAGSDVKIIRLTRNFGQTAAIAAGIKAASGEWIITMDADSQNDPADIPALMAKAREGYDVVGGWRKNRKDPFLTRTLPSALANRLISLVTGIKMKDYGCTLKIYRSSFLKNVELYGEMHRFIPALLGYMGARIAEIPVNHRPRTRGSSKYGIIRIFKVILDLMTVKFMGEYISKPIYVFGGTAIFFLFFSAVFSGITLYKKFHMGIFVKDQPLFLVAILFAIIGVQFALLGILAEILARTYFRISGKTGYIVRGEK